MKPIYEPKGRALEYAPLALNLFTGCPHACKYCYGPGVMHKKRKDFHNWLKIEPRRGILDALEKQCQGMAGDPRIIHLCFSCDPYPNSGPILFTTEVLKILEAYKMNVQILTKHPIGAKSDFVRINRNNWTFGTTLTFLDSSRSNYWEPGADSPNDRIWMLLAAHGMGIRTWISLEPVIDPGATLQLIMLTKSFVDHFKIGKINYHKQIEENVDWKKFVADVRHLLKDHDYYLKKDLLEAAGE